MWRNKCICECFSFFLVLVIFSLFLCVVNTDEVKVKNRRDLSLLKKQGFAGIKEHLSDLNRNKNAMNNVERMNLTLVGAGGEFKEGDVEVEEEEVTPLRRNGGGASAYGGVRLNNNDGNSALQQLTKIHAINKKLKDAELKRTDACDFEKQCHWNWKSADFQVVSYAGTEQPEFALPKVDASEKSPQGHFLILHMSSSTTNNVNQIRSPRFNKTDNDSCKISFSIYQKDMDGSALQIVVDTLNHTKIVVAQIPGDNTQNWVNVEHSLSKQLQPFNIILEVVSSREPYAENAFIAFDNIKMVTCFAHQNGMANCSSKQYRCNNTNICINKAQVCDINIDCDFGDDERHSNCEKIPYGARCNFEEDWCGWYNDQSKTMKWIRDDGSLNKSDHRFKDHTYNNSTGRYLHVVVPDKDANFASIGTLNSVVFNPPPRVHGNQSSRYYNSCVIRFYLHQSGHHKSGFSLQVTEIGDKENKTTQLLWSFSNYKTEWVRQVVTLPNITNKYYIHFDVKKGIRYVHAIAIDDFSLSPECFGLNIPEEELDGYNYWNHYEIPTITDPHEDFINKTYYEISTCGKIGKYGPTQENCSKAYNNTNVKVDVNRGIQKWRVPNEGYYTFILYGASGGKGSSGMGSSRGAMVRTVIELAKGDELYMVVGQEGQNACLKSLHMRSNSQCRTVKSNLNVTGIRAVLRTEVTDGGGGGGGATFLYKIINGNKIPLAIASGGGGLGLGRFIDNEMQHGQGMNTSKPNITGFIDNSDGRLSPGAGGGWKRGSIKAPSESTDRPINGFSLYEGAVGGNACYLSNNDQGDGGFGGGGGGCVSGGGGGGIAGGNAHSGRRNTSNGEGGYSFYNSRLTLTEFSETKPGYHSGPGAILIIPAIPGCGCDYRCIALDAIRADVKCICPQNWKLGVDEKQCELISLNLEHKYPVWIIGGLIALAICLTAIIGVFCFVLYNRYQHMASEKLRRRMLNSGPDFQLNSLRVASESMMTEYNPNYQFGGGVYSLKDLKDIPRDQLRLVKALGQGAFGEVYQGFFRQRSGDTIEMPVAVKTLPELSTNQAEVDFLMEALIMSKFNHPNIVHFIGVCFDKHPRFIVLELLPGGDLKNFLRESRPQMDKPSNLSMKDLILVAMDVAKGCRYLEQNRFIHRDIAARNCLLTSKGPERAVKIADFGMSRDIYRSDYYRKGGKAMLPIKWMPPEAFLDGIFTSKTDVWSYGVLLWEIMSLGYMPYTGCANREVMSLVTRGGRLEPPTNCPGPIYAIMSRCWHPNPDSRPDFGLILERLDYCLQDPEVIKAPLPVFCRPSNICERDITIMRPPDDDECLQVPQSTDYLIPNCTDIKLATEMREKGGKIVEELNGVNVGGVGGGGGGGERGDSTSSVDKLLPEEFGEEEEEDEQEELNKNTKLINLNSSNQKSLWKEYKNKNNSNNSNNTTEQEEEEAMKNKFNSPSSKLKSNNKAMISHSKSTQPLLQNQFNNHTTSSLLEEMELESNLELDSTQIGSNEKLLDLDSNEICYANANSHHNNNITTSNNKSSTTGAVQELVQIKSGVSLDPSALVKQAMKYANSNTNTIIQGSNGIIPSSQQQQQQQMQQQQNYMNNTAINNATNKQQQAQQQKKALINNSNNENNEITC